MYDFWMMYGAVKDKNLPASFESLAYLYGDVNTLSSDCKDFQTGWNHAMDDLI